MCAVGSDGVRARVGLALSASHLVPPLRLARRVIASFIVVLPYWKQKNRLRVFLVLW
jgi:hypothetical protein